MQNKSINRFLLIIAGYSFIYATFEILAKVTGDTINPWNAILISSVVVIITIIVQTILFKYNLSQFIEFLGIGKPTLSSILSAFIISILLFLCYPLISLITGYKFQLPENWIWLALGVFVLHGIAEEMLYRGFLFRHLRTGRSFSKAVWLSILFFAVAHIPIMFTQNFFVGITAVILAAVLSFPLSKLYENGNNTIWAPAIVHTAIDTIIPILAAEKQPSMDASILWMIAGMIFPYTVFLTLRKRDFISK